MATENKNVDQPLETKHDDQKTVFSSNNLRIFQLESQVAHLETRLAMCEAMIHQQDSRIWGTHYPMYYPGTVGYAPLSASNIPKSPLGAPYVTKPYQRNQLFVSNKPYMFSKQK